MDWIDQRFIQNEDRIACFEADRDWTYKGLQEAIDRFAKVLAPVVDPKPSVIAIRLDSALESLAALFAIARSKQIALPLSAEEPIAEQEEKLHLAGARFVLDDEGLQPLEDVKNAPKLIDVLSDRSHAGLILFSSGTSGRPKGMLHDFDELLKRYQRVKTRSDRTVQLLLTDHIGGLDSAFRTLFSGSALIIPEERAPLPVGKMIEQCRVNILPASPTFLNLMLLAEVAEKFDCSSLEVIAYGAEPMPKSLLERLIAAFPNARFQQKFGTSETGAIRIKSQQDGSLHFCIEDSDVEWRVIDEELWLKTSSRILGYLNADNASLEADGWYRTGDLVEESEDGYLRIIGRLSDWINVGGRKVHPSEIEQIIAELEGVDACHVFGKTDAIAGSAIGCKIVTRLNDDTRTWKRRIRGHCRGRLAGWKIPVSVELSDELATTDRLKRV